MLNSDYREILSAFFDAEAEYLLVGAYALAAHGLIRATSDIGLADLATNKRATGRPQDLADLEWIDRQDRD